MTSVKIKSVIFLAALIMVSLVTVSAYAGVVSVMNTDQNNPYLVKYEELNFGNAATKVKCVDPGQSESIDNVINAIVWIAVYTSKCSCSSCTTAACYGGEIKKYTVSGTPTAFRKFVVTIADGPQVIIAEQK